jgi:nicotinate phosphoribosyltransferase
VVTNDLNEHTIAGLRGSPVDVFGVGTSVVTGSGAPAVGLVYKLVARTSDDGQWVPVAKKSSHKANPGGHKRAIRILENGSATEERVTPMDDTSSLDLGRDLIHPLMESGESLQSADPHQLVHAARLHHAKALTEMPAGAFSLGAGEPAIPTRVVDLGAG